MTNKQQGSKQQGSKKFDVIYADCPWHYYGSPNKHAAAGKHYTLMGQEELKSLPICSLLKKQGALFLWATGPRLNHAIELIKAWNLHYRGVAFVWVKTRKDGKIIYGQGVPPTFSKPTTEFVLHATTCKTGRPIKLKKFNTPQVILAPRGAHSEKPEIFRILIEDTYQGSLDKLELFARKTTDDWHSIGDEIDGLDIRLSIAKLLANETHKL
jgi:N6-adenosine-specific RNA methylase IME4